MSKKQAPCDQFDIFLFDTETTGLDDRAEILEFGGVLLDGRTLEQKGQIHSLIRPSSPELLDAESSQVALRINGLGKRKDELLAAPTKHEFIQEWWKLRQQFRKPWKPSGYNISGFDLPKLRYMFWQVRDMKPKFNVSDFFHYHNMDVMQMFLAQNWFNEDAGKARLNDACASYGIDMDAATRHTAMGDVMPNIDLLRAILKSYLPVAEEVE